jgi:hypothetical protein
MIRSDEAGVLGLKFEDDPRFSLVDMVYLDQAETEWKAVYRFDQGLAEEE